MKNISFGIMNPAYQAPKKELLEWIKESLWVIIYKIN